MGGLFVFPNGSTPHFHVNVDFTRMEDFTLANAKNSIVRPNLLECRWWANEAYYGKRDYTLEIQNEIWYQADYWFGPNFDFGKGMKIFRLQSFNVEAGVNNADWIIQLNSSGSLINQPGVNEAHEITACRNSGDNWCHVTGTVYREQWQRLRLHYRLNTEPGRADGLFEAWWGNQKIFYMPDLDLFANGATYNRTFNRIVFGGWYSNGAKGNTNPNPDPGPNILRMRNVSYGTVPTP